MTAGMLKATTHSDRMVVTLSIHIGLHKTGTTTIQQSMNANRQTLLDHGLLYPLSGQIWGAHYLLPFALNERSKQNPIVPPDLDSDKVFDDLRDEIARSPQPQTLVSAEAFAFLDSDQVGALWEYVQDLDPRIVVYLRRQDLLIESEFGQRVKQYEMPETRSFTDFVANCETILPNLNFHTFLERWAGVFGDDRIDVGILEPPQLNGGELISDLLLRLDIDATDSDLSSTMTANITPDARVIEFLRLSNQVPMELDQRRTWNARVLSNSARIDQKTTFYRSGEREQVLARFARQNELVALRYFGRTDGRLFFVQPDQSEARDLIESLSASEVMELATKLLGE